LRDGLAGRERVGHGERVGGAVALGRRGQRNTFAVNERDGGGLAHGVRDGVGDVDGLGDGQRDGDGDDDVDELGDGQCDVNTFFYVDGVGDAQRDGDGVDNGDGIDDGQRDTVGDGDGDTSSVRGGKIFARGGVHVSAVSERDVFGLKRQGGRVR